MNLENRMLDVEKVVVRHDSELKVLDQRVTNLENISLKLENTILREGQETRKILEQVIKHTQNMEKMKFNLWVKLLGTGGLMYIIAQAIISNFGGK
jgi:regulator of replication initiation timing